MARMALCKLSVGIQAHVTVVLLGHIPTRLLVVKLVVHEGMVRPRAHLHKYGHAFLSSLFVCSLSLESWYNSVLTRPLRLPHSWRPRLSSTTGSRVSHISVEFLSTFVTGSLSIEQLDETSTNTPEHASPRDDTPTLVVTILSGGCKNHLAQMV